MQQFRQWNQMNVDFGAQKMLTSLQEIISPGTLMVQQPKTYLLRQSILDFENYETDTRSRYFGNVALDNKINDWLSAMVRFSLTHSVKYKKRESMLEVLMYLHITDVTAMFLNSIMMQC
jgi:hypothetical protein